MFAVAHAAQLSRIYRTMLEEKLQNGRKFDTPGLDYLFFIKLEFDGNDHIINMILYG